MSTYRTNNMERISLSTLAKNHPGAVLSASAAILYTYTWMPYNAFYWQLGTSPSEVGVDYIAILERAIGLLLTGPIVFFLVAWLVSSIVRFIVEIKGNYPLWASIRNLAPWIVAAAFITILCMNLYVANQLVDAVKKGESVDASPQAGWLPTTISHLWIRATRSTVSPTTGGTTDTLIYLGTSGGTAVFYDHDSQGTVRMPSNSVVIKAIVDAPTSTPANDAQQ